ncbi:carboxylesterase/lipase family protein [Algoriphagus pacificus]|uniref:Carboxylic ester hydrolase n=1 Tax=Algoriphagus pacificus TaxID=2811234 RepID=A0ABS3CDX5_9BACT|nr:carboxylesterase family protein [Algoriphagus pacificus]MBN7815302.1 carboxylesterase family protein [Algoriphagus pacificus]
MRSLFFCTLLIVFISCQKEEAKNQIDFNHLSISDGIISGKLVGEDSIKTFMGIPFAAPPVGDLRWKAPQPVQPWEGVKETVENPASSIQNPPVPFFAWSEEFLIPPTPISEDCLYLNVWTDAESPEEKRPVMVWIHGGGFSGGSGTVPLYDGEELAKKGIVVVTINYRLGALGYLAHPELSKESESGTSGNYGVLDQIAALKWVNKNIAAFGGDPDNVTIAGQSAGSMSVNVLVGSPLAKGLFNKAIAQSGAMFNYDGGRASRNKELAESAGLAFMEKMGAASVEELRNMPADSILAAGGGFWPYKDDHVIPVNFDESFKSGTANSIKLMTGWNADDNVSFGPAMTPAEFKSQAKEKYQDKAERYLELFPANSPEELEVTRSTLGELMFGYQSYTWARIQSELSPNSAYVYHFTRIPPGEPNYGAFHSAEFSYAFHTLNKWNRPFESVDYRIEDIMSQYWANFVKTGNPNGEGLPTWPAYDPANPKVMELGTEIKPMEPPHFEQVQFLQGVYFDGSKN